MENAYGHGDSSCDITVHGRGYTVDLKPPYRQILKSDRTKIRRIERELPGPSALEQVGGSIRNADPKACCATRLRRHALLTICISFSMWVGTCIVAMSLEGAVGDEKLVSAYVHSLGFWLNFMQMVASASGSKLAVCVRSTSIARTVLRLNLMAAFLGGLFAILCVVERTGAFAGMLTETASFLLINNLTLANLGVAVLLHLNLALQAWIVRRSRRHGGGGGGRQHSSKKEPPLPIVAPLNGQHAGGGVGGSSSSSSLLPTEPSPNKIEDDGRRVTLDPREMPKDDSTYLMYHGTKPEAADQIERFGFIRSRDGMLGEGVYLSRDVTKAAHYPLDVRADDHDRRVILECLVNVGKVKRIESLGHPMQKTWMILGYDTAWVPPHCGMVASGLEEDCVFAPDRIIVLRRVQVREAARVAAAKKAIAAQQQAEKAKEDERRLNSKIAAASGGKGEKVRGSSVKHSSGWRAPGSSSSKAKKAAAPRDGDTVNAVTV